MAHYQASLEITGGTERRSRLCVAGIGSAVGGLGAYPLAARVWGAVEAEERERARLNVVRAVRSAMRRIAASDADLGAQLEATIRTGTTCTYTPDPRVDIAWRVSTDGAVSD